MFDLEIITPEGKYGDFTVESITLPSVDGQRTILKNHMPLVIPMELGVMYLKRNDEKTYYFVSEGIFTFEKNQAKLILSTIENEAEIDFNRAERAKERALDRMNNYQDKVDMKRAEMALKRSLLRLRLRK